VIKLRHMACLEKFDRLWNSLRIWRYFSRKGSWRDNAQVRKQLLLSCFFGLAESVGRIHQGLTESKMTALIVFDITLSSVIDYRIPSGLLERRRYLLRQVRPRFTLNIE